MPGNASGLDWPPELQAKSLDGFPAPWDLAFPLLQVFCMAMPMGLKSLHPSDALDSGLGFLTSIAVMQSLGQTNLWGPHGHPGRSDASGLGYQSGFSMSSFPFGSADLLHFSALGWLSSLEISFHRSQI